MSDRESNQAGPVSVRSRPRTLAEAHRRLDELEVQVRAVRDELEAQAPMLSGLVEAMGCAPDPLGGRPGKGALGLLHTLHAERHEDSRAQERWRRRAAAGVAFLGVLATALTIADRVGAFR